jgi:hypothetical protein
MKKLGYTMAHIWACPPSEGDDYIFHSHPAEQKMPKPRRLQVQTLYIYLNRGFGSVKSRVFIKEEQLQR